MLEVALVNSWVLYKCTKEQQETRALGFQTTPLKANRILSPSENPELLGLCHLGKGTKRKCVQCKITKQGIRVKCGVPLCDILCYDIHSFRMKKKNGFH